MEISIIEHIEFQNKAADVVLIATVIYNKQDGSPFIDNILWDKSAYTPAENNLIIDIVFSSKIYNRIFAAYDSEAKEIILERSI